MRLAFWRFTPSPAASVASNTRVPGSLRNSSWTFRRSSRLTPPWMVTIAAGSPSSPPICCLQQVAQRVAVLREDDQLTLTPRGIAHLRGVLQQFREFVPLAILAG